MDVAPTDTEWYALVVLADGTTSLYTSSLSASSAAEPTRRA